MASKNASVVKGPVKMTDEMRTKLNGYSIASGAITVLFTPDLPGVHKDYLPTFRLRTLTVEELELVRDRSSSIEHEEYLQNTIMTHIVGWSNFIDIATDELVEYVGTDDSGCEKELFSKIPTKLKIILLQGLIIASMG